MSEGAIMGAMAYSTGITTVKAALSDDVELRPRIIFGGVIATTMLLVLSQKADSLATAFSVLAAITATVNIGPDLIGKLDSSKTPTKEG